MYCEQCNVLFDGDRCPICWSKKVREPRNDDYCFLTEKEMIWGEMLADVLKQNKIPSFYKKTLGAGLAIKVGPAFERYQFYVLYKDLPAAKSLVDELFSATAEGEN